MLDGILDFASVPTGCPIWGIRDLPRFFLQPCLFSLGKFGVKSFKQYSIAGLTGRAYQSGISSWQIPEPFFALDLKNLGKIESSKSDFAVNLLAKSFQRKNFCPLKIKNARSGSLNFALRLRDLLCFFGADVPVAVHFSYTQ